MSCNLQRISSSGRCAVSVWGAISSHGLGPLVRMEGRFNAAAYEDIVDSVVINYALDGPFADRLYYWQYDRSPIHMARSLQGGSRDTLCKLSNSSGSAYVLPTSRRAFSRAFLDVWRLLRAAAYPGDCLP
ncbi:hypothetical protein HPB48_021142 [Haemaphysalis longicornis]|uniref:Uncharacterized protein n=1 Tax=Haemaphysalis longicornis TaxID=44386 RepID=A0A9J6G8X5_HAELO|nr:hypothetical protein HPB48_021142 [Haemaphysalis longicornis]